MHSIIKSFGFAIQGIKDALKSEPNLRFHFIASILVIGSAIYLKFNLVEITILILTILFVITLELINTLIEKVVDMHSTEISESARVIKDISAGTVLFSAIGSILIGLMLFLPKIFS